VYRQTGITRQSAVLIRLLTHLNKEIGTVRVKNTQKEKVEKDDSEYNRNKAAVPLYGSSTV